MTAYGRLDRLLSVLKGVRESGTGYQSRCPAHDDRRASLSISRAQDGKILVYCHAGCTTEAVVEALGLTMSDLFPPKQVGSKPMQGKPRVLATYDYVDADGALLYQVVRYQPKRFRQRRPDGRGGWIWDLKGVTRVLYRLPQVPEAATRGDTIYVAEGEKDVATLEGLGLAATCNPGGAGKWQKSYSQSLRDANVVILPHNDGPGRDHGEKVAASLQGVASSVKVVELPRLLPKGDVSDWIHAGGTAEELLRLVQQTAEWMPPEPGESAGSQTPDSFQLTDLGNSERLVAAHGEDIRFVPAWRKWLIWDGVRWRVDDTLEVERRAKETVRRIYGEAEQASDTQERKRIAGWAMHSESHDRIRAMIRLAESEPTVTPAELDTDPYLLCCTNGMLDLTTGKLLPSRRENYITKQVPVEFDGSAEAPLWHSFLERVLPDEQVRRYVQKAVGYSLTADVSEECIFFSYGGGANGKTTLIETISTLLGDYFTKARSDTFMLRRNVGIPNDIAALFGSRLVTVSEISSGQKLDEGLVKDLTGGDTIAARFMRAEWFTFKAGFKLWLYGNHKPTICGKDEGIWRRIRLIPFVVQIPPEERDTKLREKLHRELPGILRWAVEGCLAWQQEGLAEPEAILDAVNEYRREQDALAGFLASCCTFDHRARVTKKELWQAYLDWTTETGEEAYESQRQFNEEIRQRPGVKSGSGTGNAAIWRGIALRSEADF